jgi:hypothetical protein
VLAMPVLDDDLFVREFIPDRCNQPHQVIKLELFVAGREENHSPEPYGKLRLALEASTGLVSSSRLATL